MKQIVAATQDWGIGFQNQLLIHIPEDMKHFRSMTAGKVVVMGHKTLLSLPDARPLKNRVNFVLSRDTGLTIPGAQVVNTVDQLLGSLAPYGEDEVFVIGGQLVYERLLPHCSEAYVTKVTTPAPLPADRYYPNLDALPRWKLADEGETMRYGDVEYRFCRYLRQAEAEIHN